MNSKILSWIILALSFVGFLDATFLTVKHYTGGPLPCSLTGGCEVVTTSAYATIGPVPLALLGGIYYLVIIIAMIAYLDRGSALFRRLVLFLSGVGFLFSLWLVYLQIFVIHALCLYCLVSAVTSTVIFLLSLMHPGETAVSTT